MDSIERRGLGLSGESCVIATILSLMYAELSMFRSGAVRIGKQSGKRTKTDMHVGDWCTVMVYAGWIEKRSGKKCTQEGRKE